MTPSTIKTGHALRSAIAHGDHPPKIVHCIKDFKGSERASGASGSGHDLEKWEPVFG
jgi:hypothetical protein